ncbi:MAG TPA: septal ring lytic transglycosylase RlpA family protein [Chitinophagaceae bacterium]|nr:septal ring lytic transglycosylase RlpA family protein [Chitinophagaceae bacterium]
MRKIILPILLVVSFSALSAQKVKERHKRSAPDSTAFTRYGTASFYAKKFDGRQTASGEIFSSQKYTAACNILPLNTWVRVTNIRNHKSVMVKINDRMHPKNKRLIDLSRIAAKDLGFIGHGLTRVKVEAFADYHPDIVSQ